MSSSVGPLSTQAGLDLLQAPLPSHLPKQKQSHMPPSLPVDPASLVGANPNNVITRNQERLQEEAVKAGSQTQALDIST
jgi:hypothetical protein